MDLSLRLGIGGRLLRQGANVSYPLYGITWAESSDVSVVTRIFDSVGLTASATIGASSGASDFDSIYPWSDIKRCNINSGVITYEEEPGFEVDGSNGDVFIEIPKFCYDRTVVEGIETRIITKAGLPVHPAFIENGNTLQKIYVSAFEGSYDGELKSISGVRPIENETAQTLLGFAQSKGSRYSLLDLRTVDAIENLMWIEFGNRNSSAYLGHGWSSGIQPVISGAGPIKSKLAESGVNRIVVDKVMSNNELERLYPGCNCVICDTGQQNIIARRKIVSVTLNYPNTGETEIVFDGEAINTNLNIFTGNGPHDTGQTESLAYKTGRTDRAKVIPASAILRTRLNSNVYRGIENVSGNVWHLLPDITFKDLSMYASKSMADYEFFKTTGTYSLKASGLTAQTENTANISWVKTHLYFPSDRHITFGKTFGTSTYDKYFGGFHYLNTGDMCIAQGGGFDHEERGNIDTMRGWVYPDFKWYLYGCRLIYKEI